ncbi:MAG: AEC family transporter [Clostridia bacterium]|nr:AEC family transporter [Clostridia bacterium]
MNLLSNAWDVAQLVIQLFLLMSVGILCDKCKWINADGAKQMTNVLLKVVTFCIIVNSFVSVEYSKEKLMHLLAGAVACTVCTLVGLCLAAPVFCKTPADQRAVLRFGTMFSNCGFMSLPLVSAILGVDGVFVVSIFVALFQVLCWTVGVKIYGHFDSKRAIKQIFLNPGTISVLFGLPLFFLQVKFPSLIMEPMGMLCDLNTPVAMIVTGFYLSKMTLKLQKGDGLLFLGASLRLVIVPMITLGILYLLGIRGNLLVACMIPSCAPSASNTSLFAVMFGGNEIYASRFVSISTILSVITMPFIVALAQLTV